MIKAAKKQLHRQTQQENQAQKQKAAVSAGRGRVFQDIPDHTIIRELSSVA